MFQMTFKRVLVAMALSTSFLLAGCQQHIAHVVVVTPHPTAPQHAGALYFVDSTAAGLTKPPYNFTSGHFAVDAAQHQQVAVVATCYGADQSNYLSGPYEIHVSVYYGGTLAQQDVTVATCKLGGTASSMGVYVPQATGDQYYLVIQAGGPWTVEVDPA